MMPPTEAARDGCSWWDLPCQAGGQVLDFGLAAITQAIAAGASQLLSEIVRVVDESTQVPLQDPTYQRIYAGFLGLAAALVGIVLCFALIVAAILRDPGTFGRAVSGLVFAGLGGALYIVLAQLLVGIDNWLSQGVVRVTGQDLNDALSEMAMGFEQVGGSAGQVAANMLLIILMMLMLVGGLILWFVLVLRQIAILVVVAFAPLLIAGYLWAPTRAWVRRATEVLIALVFTKTAIFTIFGIGLALLGRGTEQRLSDFVGTLVLVIGACFAPLLMLRLVHFAADTNLAGDVIGTLKSGISPVTSHLPQLPHGAGRHEMARPSTSGHAPEPSRPEPAITLSPRVTPWEGTQSGAGGGGGGTTAGGASVKPSGAGGTAGAGATTQAAGVGAVAGAASAIGAAATVTVAAGEKAADVVQKSTTRFAEETTGSSDSPSGRHSAERHAEAPDEPPLPGPPLPRDDGPTRPGPAEPGPDGGQR